MQSAMPPSPAEVASCPSTRGTPIGLYRCSATGACIQPPVCMHQHLHAAWCAHVLGLGLTREKQSSSQLSNLHFITTRLPGSSSTNSPCAHAAPHRAGHVPTATTRHMPRSCRRHALRVQLVQKAPP